MSNRYRCDCGCRAFLTHPLVVLTSDGDVWGTKDFIVASCARCNRKVTISGGQGDPKVVKPFPAGHEGERLIMLEALEATANTDHPELPNFLLRTEEDKVDVQRLNLPEYIKHG